MQKSFTFFLFVVLSATPVLAQDTLRRFLTSDLQVIKNPENASFSVDIIKKDELWEAIIYYANGKLAGTGTFKTKKLETRHGKFISYYSATGRKMYEAYYDNGLVKGPWQSWYENGKKKDSGLMYDTKKNGYWVTWHFNGNKASEGAYRDFTTMKIPESPMVRGSKEDIHTQVLLSLRYMADVKTGVWNTWYENGQQKEYATYNEDGKQNGLAKTWYANGKLESAGVYNNGVFTGRWDWFHPNGAKATVEEYKEGKITDLQCFDTQGNSTGPLCSIDRKAMYPGGPAAFDQYIDKNQQYPDVPGKPEGYVELKLRIDTNGKPTVMFINQSTHLYFTREANRLIHSMPAWEPAVAHNRPVSSEVTVWCRFKPPKKRR